ncbi:hypothetical protein S7S_03935 [Isoalcanivorax pacificus W11-5]|uniref:Uncharacterized protein n=1 Tax=Isoalcanivorax pacificus W11-5 TaxID=391936 RepID=A0A0B4XGH4_9GAMM|nr:hypothetical protein [Isoalcanivorax pacificus]AJD47209.1 hypothetical protein S7S_03935 [Isoalcanivorax pacificus W11-5]
MDNYRAGNGRAHYSSRAPCWGQSDPLRMDRLRPARYVDLSTGLPADLLPLTAFFVVWLLPFFRTVLLRSARVLPQ